MDVEKLVDFIKARELVRKAHDKGYRDLQSVSGLDPIITKYRFCNVRRNDDRVTKWIHLNYMDLNDPFPWFTLTVARLFNYPQSLSNIKQAVIPFRPATMADILQKRKLAGLKNFNAAYIVSTNGRAMDKATYLIEEVLEPLWAKREAISASLRGATLAQAHELLERQNGLGSFMAAQVLADLKYLRPEEWSDFHTFAASGPGSKRGLNRVLGRDIKKPMREQVFRDTLMALRAEVNRKLRWKEPLTAQDLQNCLCEYDKYRRAQLGTGVPKQIYKPHVRKD